MNTYAVWGIAYDSSSGKAFTLLWKIDIDVAGLTFGTIDTGCAAQVNPIYTWEDHQLWAPYGIVANTTGNVLYALVGNPVSLITIDANSGRYTGLSLGSRFYQSIWIF